MARSPKTGPTDVDPAEYCAGLPAARRRSEGARLLALFGEVTGTTAVMWGPSMIGYGADENVSASGGSRGTWFRVGFAPRASALSLYGLQCHDGSAALLDRLGKHRLGAGCVYANSLADVDEQVLRELVALAWASAPDGRG
ncbi:DUF1801 domain-containing protein [Brachybacterium sp. DNPG3]